jgi:hypothetical protein
MSRELATPRDVIYDAWYTGNMQIRSAGRQAQPGVMLFISTLARQRESERERKTRRSAAFLIINIFLLSARRARKLMLRRRRNHRPRTMLTFHYSLFTAAFKMSNFCKKS